MTITQRSGIHVTGNGAAALAQALSDKGVALATHAKNAGVVVVAQDGATPARTLAMQAIGMGQSVISANPLLWALSGQQLAAAASSQKLWLGMEGALLGSTPLAPYLATPPQALTMVFSSAADELLQRLTHNGETPVAAEAQLRLLRKDMSDLQGKQTAARASIVGALAYGSWNVPTRRTGLESLQQTDVTYLTRAGTTLRYAATVTAQGITAAPMAFGSESPFATMPGSLVADDATEPTTLMATSAPESTRAIHGILADIRLWKQRAAWGPSTSLQHPYNIPATSPHQTSNITTFYTRAPALFRTEITATAHVLKEQFDGHGTWQAILQGTPPSNAEAFVLEVKDQPQSTNLRATA